MFHLHVLVIQINYMHNWRKYWRTCLCSEHSIHTYRKNGYYYLKYCIKLHPSIMITWYTMTMNGSIVTVGHHIDNYGSWPGGVHNYLDDWAICLVSC